MTKDTPFKYVNLINDGDQSDIIVDSSIYNQFIVNRSLSLHLDTLAVANEVNKYPKMDNQMHFDFLRRLVTPRKRWAKWPKPKTHPDASLLSRYYGISMRKSYDLLRVVNPEIIEQIKAELEEIDR
jgi:hypothetical protein